MTFIKIALSVLTTAVIFLIILLLYPEDEHSKQGRYVVKFEGRQLLKIDTKTGNTWNYDFDNKEWEKFGRIAAERSEDIDYNKIMLYVATLLLMPVIFLCMFIWERYWRNKKLEREIILERLEKMKVPE